MKKPAEDLKPGDVVVGTADGSDWASGPLTVSAVSGTTAQTRITWKGGSEDSVIPGTTIMEVR